MQGFSSSSTQTDILESTTIIKTAFIITSLSIAGFTVEAADEVHCLLEKISKKVAVVLWDVIE